MVLNNRRSDPSRVHTAAVGRIALWAQTMYGGSDNHIHGGRARAPCVPNKKCIISLDEYVCAGKCGFICNHTRTLFIFFLHLLLVSPFPIHRRRVPIFYSVPHRRSRKKKKKFKWKRSFTIYALYCFTVISAREVELRKIMAISSVRKNRLYAWPLTRRLFENMAALRNRECENFSSI